MRHTCRACRLAYPNKLFSCAAANSDNQNLPLFFYLSVSLVFAVLPSQGGRNSGVTRPQIAFAFDRHPSVGKSRRVRWYLPSPKDPHLNQFSKRAHPSRSTPAQILEALSTRTWPHHSGTRSVQKQIKRKHELLTVHPLKSCQHDARICNVTHDSA